MKIFNLAPVFSLVVLLFFSMPVQAIEIIKTKDNKVLLDLEDTNVAVNQKILLLNSKGKKVALATILQTKNGRALAIISKGNPSDAKYVELYVEKISEPSKIETPEVVVPAQTPAAKGLYRLNNIKYSGLVTLAMNTMNTKQSDGTQPVPNQEDVNLNGYSVGVTGALDYPYKDLLILRGTIGYEPYSVSGTSKFLSCDQLNSTTCKASMQYLSAGGYLRFNLTKSQYQYWVGVGGTGKFPISKSTTALRADDIKYTMTLAFAGGLDYFLNNKNFVPVSVEYQFFESSETVSANLIMLRGGYGWAF